jgi:hypothetical protein
MLTAHKGMLYLTIHGQYSDCDTYGKWFCKTRVKKIFELFGFALWLKVLILRKHKFEWKVGALKRILANDEFYIEMKHYGPDGKQKDGCIIFGCDRNEIAKIYHVWIMGVRKTEILMVQVHSMIDNSYVGTPDDAIRYMNMGMEKIQNRKNDPACTANIGYLPEKKKWCGWSHRAMREFGIGDILFEEFLSENEVKNSDDVIYHKNIENIVEAKQSACNFAECVS